MSTELAPSSIPDALAEAIEKVGIALADSADIAAGFAPHWIRFRDAADRAAAVTDPQTAGLIAKELKAIRGACDKTRAALKEASLRRGQAIDGLKRHFEHAVLPIEKAMEDLATAEARREQARKDALATERRAALLPFCDPTHYALGDMPQDQFDALLAGQRAAKALRDSEAAAQAEAQAAERKAQELRDKQRDEAVAAERKRAAEQAAKDREALEKAQATARAAQAETRKLQAERDEQERQARDELNRRLEQERKQAAAPDRDKLLDFALEVAKLRVPDLATPEARLIGEQIHAVLLSVVERIHIAADSL